MRAKLLICLLGGALSGLLSCASPTARLEPKILEFHQRFPDHLRSYAGVHRQMQYAWTGDPANPPLIFVHGSPGSWNGWVEFLLNESLQKHFQVIAVDRPGYGGSGAGETEPSLKNQAEDVLEVLKQNTSGRPAILVGHSYGGAVIAQMAMDQPTKVRGLIFVASSVDPELEHTKWYQIPAGWWPLRHLIPTDLRVCNEEILALKPALEAARLRWVQIQARVISIQGSADSLVPPENQDFILQHTPPDQLLLRKRVIGMNHFVPWEHPELILEAIARFSSDR